MTNRNWKAGAFYLGLVALTSWAVYPLQDRLDERLIQHDDFDSTCVLVKNGVVGELEDERICVKGKRIVLREVME